MARQPRLTRAWLAPAVAGLLLAACAGSGERSAVSSLPSLPLGLSNNAVAVVKDARGTWLYSFLGLEAGRQWSDTHAGGWVLAPGAAAWRSVGDVPGPGGRLAGVAAAAGGAVYVVGGYTVAEDHSEVSVPSVHRIAPGSDAFEPRTAMPVPVDDTVALVYRDRFIYLVSGWHDYGNVNLVQRYDSVNDSWDQATPFPGTAVFGHAGGIVGDSLVICDGVGIETASSGPRRFVPVDACYLGRIDAQNPRRIEWHRLPSHPGPPLYRMAAAG
ncbi:MAG: galactose oxidase, partial [Pseudomonadota bacterium]